MASGLALRFRSHLLRTASLFHCPLCQPPFNPSSPLIASFSNTRSILLDSSSWSPLPDHRFLSIARRQPPRSKKTVDIGARARQLQNRRLWTYSLTFGCVAGFIVIVLNNFQDQLVFYVTPTDALEKFRNNPSKTKFRLKGLVLEGSVVYLSSSPDVEFVITDIVVRHQGSLPDLFKEGHSVVVEGFVKPFTEEIKKEVSAKGVSAKARSGDCYTEVLAKHDEKYIPKEVAATIGKNKKIIETAGVPAEGPNSS